jgi:hypothetical protein
LSDQLSWRGGKGRRRRTDLEFGRCRWDVLALDDDVMLLSCLLPLFLRLVADVMRRDPAGEEDTDARRESDKRKARISR